MATVPLATPSGEIYWGRLARRARWSNRAKNAALYAFLIAVSVPIILPYFWLATIAFSARTGIAETYVLWRSVLVLVPAIIACWIVAMLARSIARMVLGFAVVAAIAGAAFVILVGPSLHLGNFIFLVERDFASVVRARVGEVRGATQFPSVWRAFWNSIVLASSQTIIVVTVASLAGYHLSRFQFPGRAGMLRSLLVLHASR
jgi:inositol-phosphate transport system permease protein